jgi:hypothetical protein
MMPLRHKGGWHHHFQAGTCANMACNFDNAVAVVPNHGPRSRRTTSGTLACPLNMYDHLAGVVDQLIH